MQAPPVKSGLPVNKNEVYGKDTIEDFKKSVRTPSFGTRLGCIQGLRYQLHQVVNNYITSGYVGQSVQGLVQADNGGINESNSMAAQFE